MMSVLGRPLAIVQMGFNLELANAPLKNQSTIAPLDPKLDITSYYFSMKLGDKDNTLDGLVGYFNSSTTNTNPKCSRWAHFSPISRRQQQRKTTPVNYAGTFQPQAVLSRSPR